MEVINASFSPRHNVCDVHEEVLHNNIHRYNRARNKAKEKGKL